MHNLFGVNIDYRTEKYKGNNMKLYITKMRMKNLFMTIYFMIGANSKIKLDDLLYKNSAKLDFMRFQDNIQES